MAGDDRNSGGMFDDEPKEVKKTYHGMFEEDRTAHKMTPKKAKTITIIVIIVALAVVVTWFFLSNKWNRDRWKRVTGISAPRKPSYSVCAPDPAASQHPLL